MVTLTETKILSLPAGFPIRISDKVKNWPLPIREGTLVFQKEEECAPAQPEIELIAEHTFGIHIELPGGVVRCFTFTADQLELIVHLN